MRYEKIFEIDVNSEKFYTFVVGGKEIRVTLVSTSYEMFLRSSFGVRTRVSFLILPIDSNLKGRPFSLSDEGMRRYVEDVENTLRILHGKIFNLLAPSGILMVYGFVQLLPYVVRVFERAETFYFRYWIAIERWDVTAYETPLRPVHEGLLLLIRNPYSLENVNIVRTPHLRCAICGELLRDWGGKKYKLNPDGYVIYDLWYEIPIYIPLASEGYINFTEDVFNRMMGLIAKDKDNNIVLIILPNNIKGLRIFRDIRSPLKIFGVDRKEIEVLQHGKYS